MPELPEVETLRRELATELVGRHITAVRIRKPDIVLPPDSPARLRREVRGQQVIRLERRGKHLLIRLGDGSVLEVQVRMTGRFALGRGAAPATAGFRHVALELDLDDGRTLFYDDVRRLGGVRVLPADVWKARSRALGPEPLAPGFRASDLQTALAGTRAPIKTALMDQERLAGIGNIYASEILHAARIDPRRPGGSLDASEVRRLHRALRRVLRDALRHAGTTLRDYRSVNGQSGRFQNRLRVYGREDAACPRCGEAIERLVQAGRSTFHCAGCQR